MISYFVGLDVSKATLDVGFLPESIPQFQVRNDSEGFAQLIACLNELEVERVLLEATGGYERAVFKALRLEGLNVVRVNPRRCRDYASAMGKIAKTDKIDAQMLAAMIDANRKGQKITIGAAMRFSRSTMKRFAPQRWKVRWPKKPAIMKNRVMRKTCRVKNIAVSVRLGWLSRTSQI